MPATKLQTHRVEKPWGRHRLYPGFPDQPADRAPIGEVWFQAPGDSTPELLIKYLFTSERLSVQVHPDDEQAHARGPAARQGRMLDDPGRRTRCDDRGRAEAVR